jgi:hypothetical protein
MPIKGAKVITHAASNVDGNFRGFVWLPSVGDIVVCAFLENFSGAPVVLGAIYIPVNTELNTTGRPTSFEGRVATDYLVHHQTGSFLRFRTKDPPVYSVDPDGDTTWKYTRNQKSEIEIKHRAGDQFLIDEPTYGQTNFTYTHNTGAQVKIDTTGNIILHPASGKEIKLGSDVSSEKLVLGDSFKTLFNNHLHPGPTGPTGVPTVPMGASHLSSKAKTEA